MAVWVHGDGYRRVVMAVWVCGDVYIMERAYVDQMFPQLTSVSFPKTITTIGLPSTPALIHINPNPNPT